MREALLSTHFVDICNRKIFKKINQYNEREFEEEIQTIPCRKVYKTQVIKNANKEDVVSTVTIYTFTKIGDKDNVDGKDVLQIIEWKSLYDNAVVGYKVLI